MSSGVGAFALAAVLLALGAMLVHRLRLPPLPAYIAVGLVLGGQVDAEALEPLPSLGLLLLLFSVGKEFGPERLRGYGRAAWTAGAWDFIPFVIGMGIGFAVGLDHTGAVLLGGVFYMSSSAVIAKLLIDFRRTGYPEGEVVLGILVLEDLVLALVLTLFATGSGLLGLAASVALAAFYLLASQVLAPHLVRFLETLADELVLLLVTAFTVGTAILFHKLGASEAVGAFLCGVVCAGLGLEERFERLLGPIRDLAVAFFFFSVGAGAIQGLAGLTWMAILLTFLVLIAKLPFDYWACRSSGLSRIQSVSGSLLLMPRGEFNLVIAALAIASGLSLVAQVAVLSVIISVPLGTIIVRYQRPLFGWLQSVKAPIESPPTSGGLPKRSKNGQRGLPDIGDNDRNPNI